MDFTHLGVLLSAELRNLHLNTAPVLIAAHPFDHPGLFHQIQNFRYRRRFDITGPRQLHLRAGAAG